MPLYTFTRWRFMGFEFAKAGGEITEFSFFGYDIYERVGGYYKLFGVRWERRAA